MAIVTGRFMENGRKVVELAGESVMIKDIFKNAIRISKENTNADEFRLTINDWSHVFYRGAACKDLKEAYTRHIREKPFEAPEMNFSK